MQLSNLYAACLYMTISVSPLEKKSSSRGLIFCANVLPYQYILGHSYEVMSALEWFGAHISVGIILCVSQTPY
jgi:hypothetical protein